MVDSDLLFLDLKFHILNKMTVKGILDSKQSWRDENILVIESPLTKRSDLESLKSKMEFLLINNAKQDR